MGITTIIWMCVIGASAGVLTVYYNSHFLGGLVRALIDIDATSPETAMSMNELGIKMTPALKHALKPDTSFSQTVLKTKDNKYYIEPNKVSMAKAKYRGKDTSIVFVLMSILILVIAGFALTYILPEAIESFGAQISEIFGGESI